jgi:hypothetical protein
MLALTKLDADFSAGACRLVDRLLVFRDPPLTTLPFANLVYASTVYGVLSAANLYSLRNTLYLGVSYRAGK